RFYRAGALVALHGAPPAGARGSERRGRGSGAAEAAGHRRTIGAAPNERRGRASPGRAAAGRPALAFSRKVPRSRVREPSGGGTLPATPAGGPALGGYRDLLAPKSREARPRRRGAAGPPRRPFLSRHRGRSRLL